MPHHLRTVQTTALRLRRPSLAARLRASLPLGGMLPSASWDIRHRWITRLLWAHVAAIATLAIAWGYGPLHAVLEAGVVAVAALVASQSRIDRRARSVAASFGLLSSSAILVHLSGGFIEMHFHFFVMIIVISLYQDWTPFLLAIAYVVVHHGTLGALAPNVVYNHPDAIANPWKWALIHGAFVLAASAASLVSWRLSEDQLQLRLRSERRAREAAEAGVRLREEFLSVATHELRTPVTSIKGYAQLALRLARSDTEVRARLPEMLARMDEQCDRLANLVTQLLDVSRIEGGKLQLERVPTDLAALVRRVADTAEQQSGRHELRVSCEEVPLAMVDGPRVEQILTNLLDNAIRYSPAGGTVDVTLAAGQADVRIAVSDQGLGIEPQHLPHIFERFYQAHRRERHGGMGLGLYISQQVAIAHGGSIVAEPLAHGSRFTVVLPLIPGVTPGSAEPQSSGAARPVIARSGARVLVVEDEPAIRAVLADALTEAGYEVETADQGFEALVAVRRARPDLIVLDKLMPHMNGTEFAIAYRRTEVPYAPILALCAARDGAEWAARINAASWVAKPFSIDILLAEVARTLDAEVVAKGP